MIERKKIDLSEERRILSHMITSTSFLINIQNIARPDLFQSSFSRTIASWVWEYFDYTSEAPKRTIEEIYLKKKKDIRNEDDIELIQEFLQNLSSDWERSKVYNVPYTVKNAIDFFKLRSLDALKEKLEGCVHNNDPISGERFISEYRKIERMIGRGIDILEDKIAIIQAFSHEYEFLFSYQGAFGRSIGPFMRGDFFAIMGAMKRGKTHYLWHTGYRAMLNGLRVLFISLEMSEQQMLRRMWQTMVGQPIDNSMIKIPYFDDSRKLKEIKFKERKVNAIDLSEIEGKQRFYRQIVRTGDIRLVTYPSYGASVKDIETELINLEYYENFVPDVVVVDYADLLRPISERMDYRHQIDSTWKSLRGMAQERSILVVTGSQTGRRGMERDVKAVDIAEDYRKLAHVTKMISLNQNDSERDDGVMRIETVVQREGRTASGQVVVLQCYDIGKAYLDSCMKDEVDMKRYEKK